VRSSTATLRGWSASAGGTNVSGVARREPRMIHLGYGKHVRADRIFAVVPIEGEDRGDGRRTYVHVEGIDQPVVASRSERAILTDLEAAITEASGVARGGRKREQDQLF